MKSRLRRQIETILADVPDRRDQLDAAMAQFGDDFDFDTYLAAWSSPDADIRNQVGALIHIFLVLQNHLFSLAQLGLREAERLGAIDEPVSGTAFERLREADGVSDRTAAELLELQDLRNRLQHFYADATPEEVHAAARTLRAEVTPFVDRYERWLSTLAKPDYTSGTSR